MIVIETEWNDLPEAAQEAIGGGPERSVYALYAHLQEAPTLNLGDRVACGQPLGSAGQTGRSGAPHLHLEIRSGPADTRFTQMVFYDTQAQEEEMAQYRLWSMSGEFASLDPLEILPTAAEP
jgi:murein DD-endopeptidase MepM/ murein hydrolase activator NlpD